MCLLTDTPISIACNGFNSTWDGVTNKEALVTEIGDVLALVKVLLEDTDINITMDDINVAIEKKLKKLKVFLPHET